jgi:carbon monoxide dehydrogenase subunit G
MKLEHRFTVAAPVEQAWEVLLDLERIAPCLPGATLTSYEGDEFTGNVRVKLGPVTMTFAGQGRFVERDPAARRIVIEASGKDKRGGGTARATIRATLRGEPDEPRGEGASTAVEVDTDLVITGRAAQFGRGMIADVSGRLLGQFTDCLAGKLAAAPEPAGEPTPPPTPPLAAEAAPAALPAAAARPDPQPRPVAEPIDLLGVTGARGAAGRLVPYVVVFLVGAVVGGGVVALLIG